MVTLRHMTEKQCHKVVMTLFFHRVPSVFIVILCFKITTVMVDEI